MNPWLNDSSPAPNNHAGFGPQGDNSMAFLQPPSTINPAQYQNQAFLNGTGRTASPAFQNPMYQPNPVIPSKRSREDSLGASPRQAPNAPPGSRSQTPGQGQFPGFNPQQANGGPNFSNAPTPFQHMQTSNNPSPSPNIPQQNFNQPGGIPRVSTASPSPFSPQHGGPQMSPGLGDQNNRVGTPQDNPGFMQQTGFGAGFNGQQFASGMGNPGQMGMNPMNMAQQQMHQQSLNAQRNYQLQMQAQARQLHAQAQARGGAMPGNPPGMMPNQQMNIMDQHNIPNPRPNNPEELIRNLQQFMAARGRPLDLNPTICGRPMQLIRLYAMVMKNGGSGRINKLNNGWGAIAQQFGFPPPQIMQAAQELQQYWHHNMQAYESAVIQQQQQRQRMAAQGQMPNAMGPGAGLVPGPGPNPGPSQQSPDPAAMNHQRTQSDIANMKMNGQMPGQSQPVMNGFPAGREQHDHTPTHRSSMSRQLDPQQMNGMLIASPSKVPQNAPMKTEPEPESTTLQKKPIQDPFVPEVLPTSKYHGPLVVEEMFSLGAQILDLKPIQPTIRELGVIDIHALTMAIKSGMHAETRVALDALVTLSTEQSLQLSLMECEDLMETLIDCAQTQIDLLAEHSVEVTDEMSLTSYEDVVRACRIETESLQDVAEFGSLAYDLDRAADRLVCITTLIRNFSFYEANFVVLGQPEVLQVVTNVIQQLGTKEMPLRTSRNTLDFMKDVIIYLSNLSTSLNLPGRHEALYLLHFLLAFAPTPSPATPNSDKVCFTMYNPNLHKYMPSAVDSLAKLLARDEPNRMYYKAIFYADSRSNPSYELLTRTFGLAIAAIPCGVTNFRAVVEARKPFLLQGMLAAEILANLAPGSEHILAKTWLESEDGFAAYLLRLVSLLSSQAHSTARQGSAQQGRGIPPQMEPDANAFAALTNRAMAVLKALVQKSKAVDAEGNVSMPASISLKKETLLGAMIQKDIDPFILRQLCSYAGMEE